MSNETTAGTTTDALRVSRTIGASPQRVFDVLADPASHATVDGTGWVREPLEQGPILGAGQVFGMAMYHAHHPDGGYRMHNRVEVFDPPRAIAWQPGQYGPDGELGFGGWTFRYDLVAQGPETTRATLTYDWSAVPASIREYISFPPAGEDHYARSLDNLAALAEQV